MKTQIVKFLLYFYSTHIVEDWSQFKPIGKIIIYPFWVIRSVILWIFSPLFIIEYLIVNSNIYKELQIEMSKIDFNL